MKIIKNILEMTLIVAFFVSCTFFFKINSGLNERLKILEEMKNSDLSKEQENVLNDFESDKRKKTIQEKLEMNQKKLLDVLKEEKDKAIESNKGKKI